MLGGRDRPRLEPAHVVVTAHAVPPPSASVAAAFAPEVWAGRPPPATGRARHLAPRRPLPGQFCAGRKNLFLFCFVWNREYARLRPMSQVPGIANLFGRRWAGGPGRGEGAGGWTAPAPIVRPPFPDREISRPGNRLFPAWDRVFSQAGIK